MQPESDPDARWVSELAAVSAARSIGAIREVQAEKALFRQLDQLHRAEGRGSYIEIDAPIELYALVRLLRPRHVVEVGVSSGVSSAYFLRALERNERGTPTPGRPRRVGTLPGASRPAVRPAGRSRSVCGNDGISVSAIRRRCCPCWPRSWRRSTCSCMMCRTRTRGRSGSSHSSIGASIRGPSRSWIMAGRRRSAPVSDAGPCAGPLYPYVERVWDSLRSAAHSRRSVNTKRVVRCSR
jgi:hypothetical protein